VSVPRDVGRIAEAVHKTFQPPSTHYRLYLAFFDSNPGPLTRLEAPDYLLASYRQGLLYLGRVGLTRDGSEVLLDGR